MATWLSRPIIRDLPRKIPPPAARLYRQDVDVAYRLLVPVRRKRGAHGAAERVGERRGIAPMGPRQRPEGLDDSRIGDVAHRVALGVAPPKSREPAPGVRSTPPPRRHHAPDR